MSFFRQHVLRYALQHKLLAAVNVLSVALGAAVFLAVQIVNQSASRAFAAGVDVVAGRAHLEARGSLPVELWPRLKAVPGCTAVTPLVEGLITVPEFPGEYLHLLGIDPFTNEPFQTFKVQDARGQSFDADQWFGDPAAVAVSRAFADKHHLHVGDPFRVQVGEREVTLRISFYIDVGEADSHFAVMDVGWAQELLGQPTRLTAVLFRLQDPQRPEPVIERLRQLLPPNAVVRSPEQRSAQVANLLAGFQLNLTALSLVSLLVGVFLIYNTVTASAARRRTEIGILRSIGGSRGLVRFLFLSEAGLYGVVGSVLGCFLGVLLARALVRAVAQTISNLYVLTSIERLYVPTWEIPLVLSLGVGSAVLGAFVPAQAAANLPPLQALNLAAIGGTSRRRRGAWAVASLALLACAGFCSWLAFNAGRIAGFGAAFFTLAGFCALSPLLTEASGGFFRRVLQASLLGRLAARNLVRSVSHHAVTVAALASALAMLVSVSIMIHSFRAAVNRWVDRRLVADVFVTPSQNEIVGMQSFVTPGFLQKLQALPEVAAWDTYRETTVMLRNQPVALGVVIGSLRSVPEFVGGRDQEKFARFRRPDAVIVSEPLARRFHLNDGAFVELPTPLGPHRFEVVGTYYDYTKDAGVMLMQRENFLRFWPEPDVNSVALYLKPGQAAEPMVAGLQQRLPEAKYYTVRSNASLRSLVRQIFEQTFAVTYALRLVAMLVAVIGIVLNLTVLVKERERELAVTRALGAARHQLVALILTEAVLLGLIALLLGVAAGCTLAVVLTEVINKAFFGWTIPLSIPWDQLALTPFLLVPVSLLSGLVPALRAARAPIIAAIRE
ncbi:MAG TPA: FtsX-like permease family protein [Chthoniobacterales bacterium]